jgi:beta-glucanase (GH16 family)
MEWVGWNPNAIYGSLHGPGYCGGNAYGSGPNYFINEPLYDVYHKYAIEWKPGCITWYIDDKLYFRASKTDLQHLKGTSNWPYDDHPFYLIVNFAVGGNFGGAFPFSEAYIYNNLAKTNELRIQYIKIYQTYDGFGSIQTY